MWKTILKSMVLQVVTIGFFLPLWASPQEEKSAATGFSNDPFVFQCPATVADSEAPFYLVDDPDREIQWISMQVQIISDDAEQ